MIQSRLVSCRTTSTGAPPSSALFASPHSVPVMPGGAARDRDTVIRSAGTTMIKALPIPFQLAGQLPQIIESPRALRRILSSAAVDGPLGSMAHAAPTPQKTCQRQALTAVQDWYNLH